MSIHCYEDGHKLLAVDEAFCITTPEANTYAGICSRHIRSIPKELRLPEPTDGLDIHFLFSRANGLPVDDTLSLRHMELGDYRFSLSLQASGLYFPRCCKLYLTS